MKTITRVSLFALFAIAIFSLVGCQPAANTNTNSNSNTNAAPKAAAPTAESLLALDTKAWDAWKSKDTEFFKTFLADNFVGFGDDGKRMTKAEILEAMAKEKCDVKSNALSDPKVTMAGPDTAVVTYKATVDGTCEDEKGASHKIPSNLTVASVFVRSGDTWKGAYHNEVPVMAAPSEASANSNKPAEEKKEAAGAEKTNKMPPPPPAASNSEKPKTESKPESKSNTAAATNSNSNSATSTSDALTEAIVAQEKKGWESWMKQDSKGIEETIGSDISFVDPAGKFYFGKADVLKEWMSGQCKVTSVDVSDAKASQIGTDVAILTYKGTAVGTCGDMKLEPIWGTTVAVKEGGAWKAVYVFETPMRKS